ncbi:ferredoxin [Lentzea tibetensis]|uniref:Ferredoxin n=1 Tax=Lentzea tibetensis TaxID=2591470 RepID=A0A563ERY2_9PSEU|nr:ferredoxin [Lentzea tibetensis]TWP50505.1 ferredoxin [Lentzea tibetensis]
MRMIVDRDRCEGHGLCEDVAPRLFQIDDDGELVVRFTGDVPAGEETRAGQAVRICPVGALRTSG